MLLVILVTIIVGVASVVAITTMQTSRTNANRDAVRQDMLMILHDAQIYYKKPEMLAGGGRSFDNISQEQILSVQPSNENGTYTISGSGNTVTVKGDGRSEAVSLSATGTMSSNEMVITWSEPSD